MWVLAAVAQTASDQRAIGWPEAFAVAAVALFASVAIWAMFKYGG